MKGLQARITNYFFRGRSDLWAYLACKLPQVMIDMVSVMMSNLGLSDLEIKCSDGNRIEIIGLPSSIQMV